MLRSLDCPCTGFQFHTHRSLGSSSVLLKKLECFSCLVCDFKAQRRNNTKHTQHANPMFSSFVVLAFYLSFQLCTVVSLDDFGLYLSVFFLFLVPVGSGWFALLRA